MLILASEAKHTSSSNVAFLKILPVGFPTLPGCVGLPREQTDMVQPLRLGYLEVIKSFHLYPCDFPSFHLLIHPFIYLFIHLLTHPSNQPTNNQTNQPSSQPTHIYWTPGTYSKLSSVLIDRDTVTNKTDFIFALIEVIVWQILIKFLFNAAFTVQNLFK